MTDALIVGGGLAGGAAAIRLARAGRSVTVIERSASPHDKVCGEFLSNEALGELAEVGIDAAAMGAPALKRVRIAARGDGYEAALPFTARSLTRRTLDEAILTKARSEGATVLRGQAVSRCIQEGLGWLALLPDGTSVSARSLVAATGKHDLRGARRPDGVHGDLVGLKAYYRLTPDAAADLSGTVDVIFFPGGYLGIQPVPGGMANACLVVSRKRLSALGGHPWAVFDHVRAASAHAARVLDGAEPVLAKPLAVGRIPYGYVRRHSDGAFHVGDQAAVIPSFCGEGMGLALRSGRMAADAILAGDDPMTYQRRFARLAGARVVGTALMSRALSHERVQRSAAAMTMLAPRVVTALAGATRTPQPRGGRSRSATPSAS